jgi:nitrite reductase/ring-hydroxylating ferredoxin subunit
LFAARPFGLRRRTHLLLSRDVARKALPFRGAATFTIAKAGRVADSLVSLCKTSDLPENSVKRFEVGDLGLAAYNVGGSFYVTDDECTHGAAQLSQGMLDGEIIECTLHFGGFDVRTGEAVQPPCFTPLRTYKVVVRDGDILVDLEKTAAD